MCAPTDNQVRDIFNGLTDDHLDPVFLRIDQLPKSIYLRVDSFALHETEFGMRVAVFIDIGRKYFYLPPRISNKLMNRVFDLKEVTKQFRVKIMYSGRGDNGHALFDFMMMRKMCKFCKRICLPLIIR